MTLGLHLLLYWQAKHSLPYLKFKLSNPKVQFNLFLAEFIWLTSWSSFSCEEEVPDSAMNGDTTWTLCTETDGDRFVSDLPAPSSAEAILMLSGDQPTRQYSIFLANTSHYWLIWMRLTVNSLGLMGWRTSFYMHFAHPGEKRLSFNTRLPFTILQHWKKEWRGRHFCIYYMYEYDFKFLHIFQNNLAMAEGCSSYI